MSSVSKSPWVIHYDGSSCNGCDIEVLAALTPLYDVERFGIINTGNPKHADIFLVTGSVNEQNISVVQEIYDQMVEPKVVVACGICACSAGIFHDCYNIIGGVDKAIPVDVYVPGCAVRPEAIIDGVVQGLAILEEKAKALAEAKKKGSSAMALHTTFAEVRADELVELAETKKNDGYRFVQMLCVNTEEGIDALYSFMKGDALENYTIKGIDTAVQSVPSVTGSFLAAFPFENEAHDLFGLNVTNIAIDFKGGFYKVAMDKPMTVISPAQKAAREKAAKIAAAKAASAKPSEEDLEKKLAGMDPEKAAKVRAAMEAKAKKEAEKAQAEKQAQLEEKLAGMDPEKAAKFRAAMEAKAARESAQKGGE